jgi:hypothetical protein
MLATGMALPNAVGTSLVAVAAFGAATAGSYAFSGLVDWRVALIFLLGGVLGGVAGLAASRGLARRKGALGSILAAVIVATGVYVVTRSLGGF